MARESARHDRSVQGLDEPEMSSDGPPAVFCSALPPPTDGKWVRTPYHWAGRN